ncbi:MAG: cysteine-rich small domain-containing protein [Oscillospiraceae bacterium]|nr:cysteine-rich small domain-containing protein [Oscillospiraceae bacterium]
MLNYQFVQNTSCECFPCHRTNDLENFNCLFCFCPLYALGDRCGGNYAYTNEGIKDCSGCMIPHCKGNYDKIMEKMELVLELAKKKLDLPD